MSEDQEFIQRPMAMIDFSKLSKFIIKDLKTNKEYTSTIKKYNKDEVARFVETPERYQKQLRDISTFLYTKSPHYKRLCRYFSDMLTFDYILEPVRINPEKVNGNSLKGQYFKLLNLLDTMNIKHEFSKISKIVYREDVFYGYEHVTTTSYFIQKLPFELCKISSVDDGCFNFAFDFSFFDRFPEKLPQYAPEFKKKYNKYRTSPSELRWQELDAENTICIKVNEEIYEYAIPPFVGVFESVFDIEDYKALRKDREEIGNYKILVQKIPMNEKDGNVNDMLIDAPTVADFHNKAVESLPLQVGLISTPMEITDVDFERDNADSDNVAKATRDYWESSGAPQDLFSANKNSVGLEKSVQTDEQMAFSLLRQFERWLNRRISFFNSSSNFRVNMLDITTYNRQEYFDRVMSAVAIGIPAKTMACAAIGISPSAMLNMAWFENDILGLTEKFIPPVSTHTQSATATGVKGGAPKKPSAKLSTEGVKSRDK